MNIPLILSRLQKAGLTQTQIGDAIGVKQSSVSDMAAGKAGIKNPSSKVVTGLSALARQHGIDPTPAPGHGGRQPPSPHNILDTVPDRAVVDPTSKPE